MRAFLGSTILLLSVSTSIHAEAKPQVIDLGGIRKVRATVTTFEREYEVEVSMRPVGAFDDATNDEINQDMAREYAIRALAQQLSTGPDVQFTIGGERTIESGRKGDRYRLVIRWPKSQVKLLTMKVTTKKFENNTRIVEKPAFQGKLFTAKKDHLDTLKILQDRSTLVLKLTVSKATEGTEPDQGKAFRKAIAQLEDRVLQQFDQLLRVINDDALLFDLTEREELRTAIEAARRQFLNQLRDAVERQRQASFSEKFSMIEITKPFDGYLRKNPLLMDLAGGIIIELSPDRIVIIGIAKTLLKNDSPAEFLRAEKVCAIKAKVAVLAERDGSKITYLKQVKDTIETVIDNDGEKVKSLNERIKLTEERIQGMLRGMPIVGRWRSADGKLFYLAIGVILNGKGEIIEE